MLASDIEDIYRLSPLQQGMLFHELAEPDSGLYVLHRGYELTGPLDVEGFQDAWRRAVARHVPLRTSLHWKDVETPVQVVHRTVALPVITEDWSAVPESEIEARMQALDAQQQRPFELERAPLMRLALVRLGEARHYFAWTFHHILMEGWSAAIVLGEVIEDYEAIGEGGHLELPKRRPFRDYLAWLNEQDAHAARAYWTEALAGLNAPVTLLEPASQQRPEHAPRWQHAEVSTQVPAPVTKALQDFARTNGITLNTIVQGAWALLLARYTGQDDVLFGATVSGRSVSLPDVDKIVGLLINTIPARVRLDPEQPLAVWLRRIQSDQARARQFEWCSLVDIHGWSAVPRSVPLFESIVVFSNWLGSTTERWEGKLHVRATRAAEGGTGYPLTVMVSPGETLGLSLAFDGRDHDEAVAARVLSHLQALLENIAADPQSTVDAISMLSSEERARILARNRTEVAYPLDEPAYRMFEQRVDEGPDRPAVTCRDVTLSYRDLDIRANRLAHYLRERRLIEDALVGVCMDRSIDMLVVLLAVMKAGLAYLPIDPALPAARVAFMLEDAGVRVVVTERAVARSVPATAAEVIELEASTEGIAAQPATRPALRGEGRLAYVMYTSGSTGKPKGVAVEHRSLANFLRAMQARPGFTAQDSVLALTTISFDISGLELFLPLVTGGSVVIAGGKVTTDGALLAEEMRRHRISVMQATPATWRLLLDSGWSGMPELKALCGGEALQRDLADRLLGLCGSLWNMYGPTETTVWSAVDRVADEDALVPIGSPIANTRVYVLDRRMDPVPEGVRGQLYIGGQGVARGYVNRPELTAERFVVDPFAQPPGQRMYSTGDVARWLPDGRLECIGRSDHQLKVRGFRIEPGEIEAVLLESAAVSQTVVVSHTFGPGDVRLVAYVVPGTGQEPMPSELRALLRKRLPEYMIPSIFTFLERLPLNQSGKVDRRALPDPTGFQTRASAGRPPETEAEKFVAEVWREVLGVQEIHAEDNFFDLGGHSLLAMRVAVKAQRHFGRHVNPIKLAFLNLSQFAVECTAVVVDTSGSASHSSV